MFLVQFQTLLSLTCPRAESIMRPQSAGGCLMITSQQITTWWSTAGGCKHTDLNSKINTRAILEKLKPLAFNIPFSPDSGARVSPHPRRTVRTVGSGGLQTECMDPALWCVTWSLTACTRSGCEAAGTPCSAPTVLRSPSTHHLHLVSWRGGES